MFTGLVETMGVIASVRRGGESVELCVRPDACGYDVAIGASVAIDGVCLTAEKIEADGRMFFTAVAETLSRTSLAGAAAGRRVNLERAMRADGRLDGHIVQGHVDAVGRIVKDERVGVSLVRTIELPSDLMMLVAEKGSITIDGISLTVAKVSGRLVSISLIPATISNTTMSIKKPGDVVNIECDVLARYICRMMAYNAECGTCLSRRKPMRNLFISALANAEWKIKNDASGGSLIDKMKSMGF